MHHTHQGEEPMVLQEAQKSSAHCQPQTKGQLQLFWSKEKAWKEVKSGFWLNRKSWWTECILGQALPAQALTFQNWKRPNQTQKPQSLTTASCANVRVQVACGWSNFSFLNVTFFLSREKLDSSSYTSLLAHLQFVAGICFKESYLSLLLSMAKTSQCNTATFKIHFVS